MELLTTTRIVESTTDASESEMLDRLIRALGREFAAVAVVGRDPACAPEIACRPSASKGGALLTLIGPVRVTTRGNKAEVMFEALENRTGRFLHLFLLGFAVWPLWLWLFWGYLRERRRAVESLKRAMNRLPLGSRDAEAGAIEKSAAG